jgi:hypothetical protein
MAIRMLLAGMDRTLVSQDEGLTSRTGHDRGMTWPHRRPRPQKSW